MSSIETILLDNITKYWGSFLLGIFIFLIGLLELVFNDKNIIWIIRLLILMLGLILIFGILFKPKPEDPKQSEKKEKIEPKDPNSVKEDARIGYQVATSLWMYEGQLVWSRFNAMLVANSIVVATIGVLLSSKQSQEPSELLLPLSIIGLILCLLWFILMQRGFNYHKYYLLSAREIEEQHLEDVVKTVSRGGDFADGKPVKVRIKKNGEPKEIPLQMSILGQIKVQWASSFVILVFAILYFIILMLLSR